MHHWISLTPSPCASAPWLPVLLFVHVSLYAFLGSPLLGWSCSIGTSPMYQHDGVWWLWLLGPMRMINLVAYNSSMTPPTHTQQSSHTLLIIMSKNTEQLPCWDCVTEVETRSWICMKLLTSPLPPVTHHKDPSPKYILKAASIISSHSGNKTEAFPPRDPHTDQIGLTWADYSSIPVVGIAIIMIVFNIRMLTVTDSWLYAFTWSI